MSLFCRGFLYSLKKPFAALVLVGIFLFSLDFGIARATQRERIQTLNVVAASDFSSDISPYSTAFSSANPEEDIQLTTQGEARLWNTTMDKLARFIAKQPRE